MIGPRDYDVTRRWLAAVGKPDALTVTAGLLVLLALLLLLGAR
jgi:hypothetical protein